MASCATGTASWRASSLRPTSSSVRCALQVACPIRLLAVVGCRSAPLHPLHGFSGDQGLWCCALGVRYMLRLDWSLRLRWALW